MSSILNNTSAQRAHSATAGLTGRKGHADASLKDGVSAGSVVIFNAMEAADSSLDVDTAADTSVLAARRHADDIVELAQQFAHWVAFAHTTDVDVADVQPELDAITAKMKSVIGNIILVGIDLHGLIDNGANAKNTTFAGVKLTDNASAVEAMPAVTALLAAMTDAAEALGSPQKMSAAHTSIYAACSDRLDADTAQLQAHLVAQSASHTLAAPHRAHRNILSLSHWLGR